MSGVYDPDSLDGLSQAGDNQNANFDRLLKNFSFSVRKFSGDIKADHISARTWIRKVVRWRRESLRGVDNAEFIAEITRLLHGSAQQLVENIDFTQPAEILGTIQRAFPHQRYQRELVKLIDSGEAFVDCEGPVLTTRLETYIAELEDDVHGLWAIAEAIHKLFSFYWEFLNMPESAITSADLIASIQEIRRRLNNNYMAHAIPFGKMVRSQNPNPKSKTSESNKSPASNAAKTPQKSSGQPSKSSQRRARQKSQLKEVLDKLNKLETAALSTNQSQGKD
ncbi:hypothetical protein LPJ64_006147 [Coemansia asiatica]|uniref:Uncharacterized protein n=1 Tax=Coemansia asiatica TaxID=1052880 RepID=A0A9W7XFV3_9FUNG|nr:hypothetical protein LPJ64_006147 [Coemansia asiatica]